MSRAARSVLRPTCLTEMRNGSRTTMAPLAPPMCSARYHARMSKA